MKLQAKVAQLVERNLAKVKVAGSRPVFRSKKAPQGLFLIKYQIRLGGGIGRHAGLKILCFHERTGSSPVPSTKPLRNEGFFYLT